MKTNQATNKETGNKVVATVGQPVSFKCDVEQQAVVKAIRLGGWDGRRVQVLVDVAEGEYAGTQWIDLQDCWN